MKKNVLIFGGNSFLAKAFNQQYSGQYNIQNVYRNNPGQDLNFDFESDDIENITSRLGDNYQAVLFFQGINPSVGAKEMTTEHFTKMLKVNLVTPALLVKHLAGKLNDGALVLFTSSVAKKRGSYDPAYASAKAGLTGLMHSLVRAYPRLRFNMVSPGLIENSPVFHNMTPDFRQRHADKMSGKFINAADVAIAVMELIDNKSINGADIEIDGGYQ